MTAHLTVDCITLVLTIGEQQLSFDRDEHSLGCFADETASRITEISGVEGAVVMTRPLSRPRRRHRSWHRSFSATRFSERSGGHRF